MTEPPTDLKELRRNWRPRLALWTLSWRWFCWLGHPGWGGPVHRCGHCGEWCL